MHVLLLVTEEEDGVESSDGVVGGRLTMDGEDAG